MARAKTFGEAHIMINQQAGITPILTKTKHGQEYCMAGQEKRSLCSIALEMANQNLIEAGCLHCRHSD